MDSFDRYVGQVFDGRYQIVKVIGNGGMAVVFEAVDLVMKRQVAVKMLKEEIANDAQSVKRFVNESKAVSMLSHPNIVSIFDISVSDNLKYIVMEYIEGITLKSYIQSRGALNLREIISFSEQTLRALEHAHSKGIIHRDIKPQNIMLLQNGQLKVTDFGIAKLPNAETVTMTDRAIGTVFYISPEQASGRAIDPRSDLYSLGVVMYEMATGKLPFVAETPVSVALMQINEKPVTPHELMPTIPPGLEQIIMGAMQKDPDQRFQSAGQMLRFIHQIKVNPNYIFTESTASRASERNASERNASERNASARNASTRKKSDGKAEAGRNKDRSSRKNDGSEPKKKRRQSRSMLPIILGVTTAFLLVIGLSAAYLFSKLFSPDVIDQAYTIQIPTFVGEIYNDELRAELDATDYYKVTVVPVYSDVYPENTIMKQDPSSGDRRKVINGKQYCDLTLTVSMGVETVVLSDYTALDYREVESKLRDIGLIPEKISEYNDILPLDYVFKTDPMPGTTLNVGDTVYIYISKGIEIINTTVPNFIGTTEKEAMELLETYTLTLGNVWYEYNDEYEAGKIFYQSVEAFEEVPQKQTTIDFIVSLGPEEVETGFGPGIVGFDPDNPDYGPDDPYADIGGDDDDDEDNDAIDDIPWWEQLDFWRLN